MTKHFLLRCCVAVACLAMLSAVAGCAHSQTVAPIAPPLASSTPATSGPAAIADRTLLDEKAMAGVELAYRSMRVALEAAVDTGLIRGDRARLAAQMERRAFSAVEALHAAYDAGNAETYLQSVNHAFDAIEAVRDVIKGN